MATNLKIGNQRTIDTEMDEAGEILDMLMGTFGPDSPLVIDATNTYVQIISVEEPTVVEYATGTSFLKWVKDKPDRLHRPPLKACRCTAKFVETPEGEWRPCERCIPEAYAQWAETEGIIDDEY